MPRPPGHFRGGVAVVRCPHCSTTFLCHSWAKSTVCRYCKRYILLKEPTRRSKLPKKRVLGLFNSIEEARAFIRKLEEG